MSKSLTNLFEKVTVMHSADHWADAHRDLTDIFGPASFSDGAAWAVFPGLSLSNEQGPSWSLLAKTGDLDAVAREAARLGWAVGEPTVGGHEARLPLTTPAGLTVVAYSSTSQGLS
ncbi:hypothetical protein CH282_01060 [Rhodococcus sp. 06-418-1B]|nr:hypothetical protein [Rhodococcus sp. 06-418-1B]OZC92894.1 hypothetical protein CH282_01060 [Rhodococcus sp. 06-418-1B]